MISFKRVVPAVFLASMTVIGFAASAQAQPVCHGRVEGRAAGQGLFGLGTANARSAAVSNWAEKVNNRWGIYYANFDNARGVRWDCKKGAILQAKCVVTALPCRR